MDFTRRWLYVANFLGSDLFKASTILDYCACIACFITVMISHNFFITFSSSATLASNAIPYPQCKYTKGAKGFGLVMATGLFSDQLLIGKQCEGDECES